jgi:hypothetical protein
LPQKNKLPVLVTAKFALKQETLETIFLSC